MKYRKGGCSKNYCNKFLYQHLKFQKQILKEKKNPRLFCLRNGKKERKVGKKMSPPMCLMAFYFSSSLEEKNAKSQKNLTLL